MGLFEIIFIAIGLAMDAFAVSLAAASSGRIKGPRATFRLSFHFGLFQFLMPVIGWFAGYTVQNHIEAFAHWIAFILLALVGGRMFYQSFRDNEQDTQSGDPSKGINLVLLSVATSIDALAVGLSLAMIRIDIWYPSIIIGLITAALSLLAIRLGSALSRMFGKTMERFGGLLLVLIGLKILFSHFGLL